MPKPMINADRIRRDIDDFSAIIDAREKGYTRISFSEQDNLAKKQLGELMTREAGLSVRIDAAGNLIGRREGKPDKPVIMMGSHLDTVRGGGRFDGIAGVVAALEVIRSFRENGIQTIHPLEVVSFQAEEPSPFGISTIGSRAMSGHLSAGDLQFTDQQDRSLADAIRYAGGDPDHIQDACLLPGDIHTYLELHIEQGPLLTSKDIPIGVVSGIFGIARGALEIVGSEDHSGTTPMNQRRDALAAASETVLALESSCMKHTDAVGTVGRFSVYPNALNVVPGMVDAGLEVRAASEDIIHRVMSDFKKKLSAIERYRPVSIRFKWDMSSRPVQFHDDVVETIKSACCDTSVDFIEMPSGAGHDASHLSQIAPSGMVFVPSKDGRSHCPQEWSDPEHIASGAQVMAATILNRDGK